MRPIKVSRSRVKGRGRHELNRVILMIERRFSPASTFEDLDARMRRKYKINISVNVLRNSQYMRLEALFGSIFYLRNARVLDLGCGSAHSRDHNPGDRTFEPWICRILHEVGAQVHGVDVLSNEGEEFEHHRLDLLQLDVLERFPANSFDVVNNSAFCVPGGPNNSSPTLQLMADEFRRMGLHVNLMLEAERLLKENGVYCLGNDLYVKGKGRLVAKGSTVRHVKNAGAFVL